MRRKYLGLAIAAMTALGPASAFGGDREIAQEIMTRLKSSRDSGALKDFTLDMKVDQGIVLFRGSVTEAEQKQLVLSATEGVDGISKVVDEVSVTTAMQASAATAAEEESIRGMLAGEVEDVVTQELKPQLEIAPGEIQTTAAVELAAPAGMSDQQVVAGVVNALGQAQRDGRLKGFGVDVKCNGGVVTLQGRAGTPEQRSQIVSITESVAGVQGVDPRISVMNSPAGVPATLASAPLNQYNAQPVPALAASQIPAQQVAAPMMGSHGSGAPVMGAPVQGTPVAMGYSGGVGAPRYDAPNLPNYAWPGYASYPNYAALTYPQQYSPSAWPYIGPFYPYPQVPLGWRKVSLEWDDGWWFLDFTDRSH